MRIVRPSELDSAARAIEAGELVIVPTARWYMICADASNADASGVIFTGKRRPSGKSLAYVAPSLAVCEQHFQLGAEARKLAEMFWPGDLALLLPWRNPEDAARHAAVGSPALTTIAPPESSGSWPQGRRCRSRRPLPTSPATPARMTSAPL
jgi:L-threonylcarbamoyladenylate synthase